MIDTGKPYKTKKNFLFAFIVALLLAAIVFTLNFILPSDSTLLKSARSDFDRGKYQKASKKFKQAEEISSPSSGVKCEARIFYATCLVRQNLFRQASVEFRKFIDDYPSSFWTPQAYFDLAYSERNLGNNAEAALIYKKIIADFPTTAWAKYSAERLKELQEKKIP